ncbi:hypothetical protein BGZ65_006890 [Modicella reniformis]|uniref:Choline kinase n=1 Tax=Modicella reniformis TaxID=1440133 RepID=A0A9P6IW52_9FUNG|nr:hypothetical protein BGZ65_006890 [Modicella reniformis]
MNGLASIGHQDSAPCVHPGAITAESYQVDSDPNPPLLPPQLAGNDEDEGGEDNDNDNNDTTALEVAPSWQEQPVHLPTYTPSLLSQDSPPSSPIDDPIHLAGAKKHFGFSARQSIASSIFPWQKHKPAVFHQYSPYRSPLSRGSSLTRLKKVLPITRADSVKHLEDEELDLLTLKGDELTKRTLELLRKMNIEDWAEVTDYHQLELSRISGAMTNCVFLVTGPPPSSCALTLDHTSMTMRTTKVRKVLLRVYGIGLESLISREVELQWLRNLSIMEIGPKLLGIFKNGRFEEYVESTTLTKEDIRDPRTSRHIAHRMCELHNIVNVFPPPSSQTSITKENIVKRIPLAREAIRTICEKDPVKKKVMEEFNFEKLVNEIEEVQRELTNVHSPLVFAHNDTQYGNILRTKDESGELVVIDFEYAGYDTRGFDIGNHFCEWTADYHSDRPSLLHPDRYPTKEEQLNFLEAYVDAEIAMCGYHLTAINLTKYAKKNSSGKKRRSLRNAIAIAIQVTSAMLKRRASGEIMKENVKDIKHSHDIKDQPPTATTGTVAAVATGDVAVIDLEGNSNKNNATVVVTNGSGVVQRLDSNQNVIAAATTNDTSASVSRENNSTLENNQPPTSSLQRTRLRWGDRGSSGGNGANDNGGGGVSKQEILDSMYKEVNKFALTSHIVWGLWGLIQATQSEIDFNYFEYALQRLGEFRRRREEFMSL